MIYSSFSIQVILFIFGACVGSFLNVCIFRLPLKKSILFPASHCPGCKKNIPFYCNLPIVSYVALMGKCKFCGSKISLRYPIVEFVTAGLTLLLYQRFNLTLPLIFWFVFVSVLIVISFIDWDHQIIPDIISLPGIIIFASSVFVIPGMTWQAVLLGVLCGGGLLYAIALAYYAVRHQNGMGGGDIKLMAMIGAAIGAKGVLFTIFAGSLLGTMGGLAILISNKKEQTQPKIPFGPFLSTGAVIYILWGEQIIHWYFAFLYSGQN